MGVPGVIMTPTNPDDDEGYLSYSSFTQPMQVHRFSAKSGETTKWAEVKAPVDPSQVTVDQVFFASKDGTKIPMFIVRSKAAKADGDSN